MSIDICKAIYRKLATDGTVFGQETFRTIKATYYREALDLIEAYYNDARMNGLHIDRHVEERAVELFASNIVEAGQTFLDNPMETPFIPELVAGAGRRSRPLAQSARSRRGGCQGVRLTRSRVSLPAAAPEAR